MKSGERTICPHCGENTIAKKQTQMEGWTKLGEILVCTFCGKKLSDVIEVENAQSAGRASIDGLAKLFNNADDLKKPKFESDGTEKPFCRDCEHFISHPFMDRCTLHDKGVNPMDDCDDFSRRTADEVESSEKAKEETDEQP